MLSSPVVITKNSILRFTCDKAVLCSASARHAFLEVFPLTKGHMERTPIVFSVAAQIGKHSLNNQSQTEKPQTKSKSRDGINPDSKFKSPDAAGADS